MLLFYLIFRLYDLRMADGSMAATQLLVTHVGPCADSPPTVMTLKELGITTQNYGLSLSGQFNITEDVESGWTVKATMQKCQDIRNVDTCDHFRSLVLVRDGCSDDDDDAETYSMLFHYSTPEIECPVRGGSYMLDDYPVFTEDNYLTVYESKISTSVFGYTFRLEGLTVDQRNLFCAEAYLRLLYMRPHNWVRKSKQQTTPTPKDEEEHEEETE